MSRKIKLDYPFNDAACLEVEYKPNQWARVTAHSFRSSAGNRRINGNSYNGPVYYEGTNYRYRKVKNEPFRLVSAKELSIKIRSKNTIRYETVHIHNRDAKYL